MLNYLKTKKQIKFFAKTRFKANMKKRKLFDMHTLNDILTTNRGSSLSLHKIKILYQREDPSFEFSIETLRRFLKQNMRFTYKSVCCRYRTAFTEKNKYLKMTFLKEVTKLIQNESVIIYLDESGLGGVKSRKKVWVSKVDDKPVPQNKQFKRVNLLAAISANRVISYMLVNENVNSDIMIEFFKKIMKRLEDDIEYSSALEEGRIYFLQDNAQIHKSEQIRTFYRKHKLNILFTSSYSPEYNFAEQLFMKIKRSYHDTTFVKRVEIFRFVEDYIKQFDRYQVQDLYRLTLRQYINDIDSFINS